MTYNTRNYPTCNPAGSLEDFLIKKTEYIASLDPNKYRTYILKTQKEIDFLWNTHNDLSYLVNFDILTCIQKAITESSGFGVSVLRVLIPLRNKINLGNQSELNLIERISYGK